MVEERIRDLLEEKFQESGFTDCFIVDIKLHANQKLEVFVDCDSGMTFTKCKQLSRYLESFIDEGGWLGERYVLEVSSPGAERPLKLARQYLNNIGRKLEVQQKDGVINTGMLTAADETNITLEEKVRIKEGKRKKTEVVQTIIPLDTIAKAVVKISFK
ncbi:MAG: ribosome maturation factor RimP [Saprospiraceae bacterium]|nr:MAG: ribosome maturation factor RimP [Saprospiraceae bacterium]